MKSIAGTSRSSKSAAKGDKHKRQAKTIKVSAGANQPLGTVETQVFDQLVNLVGIKSDLQLGYLQEEGNGLLASQKKGKNEVLMAVPKSLAIIVDYNEGLQISSGKWPRLRQGVSAPEPLPWDMMIALALVDGLAGDGDSFWGPWCQAVLPPPEALTLPMCWGKTKLKQLQHAAIIEGALKQQERLKSLFPGLMGDEGEGWFAWAFACVRSRAFKINDDIFAFVPFLDMANHSPKPNANFRLNAASGAFELVALEEVDKGQHVTISYSGEDGLTNQRFMAQYGFVPPGNLADRIIEFEVPPILKAGSPAKLLQLARVQDRFGDGFMMDAANGKNPYLWSALKSLPFTPEADDAGSSNISGDEHLELACNLNKQCEAMLQGFATTIEQDEEILKAAAASSAGDASTSGAPESSSGSAAPPAGGSADLSLATLTDSLPDDACATSSADPCYVAAVRYRLERKKLLKACSLVLNVYTRAK